jgi:WhiB family redox-sensing transcriptional regulator
MRNHEFPIPPQKGLDLAFMEVGNCRDMDPEHFYPTRGETSKERAARAVCRGCEVKQECLEYALTPPVERFGIWGGMSEKERRRVRSATLRSAMSA